MSAPNEKGNPLDGNRPHPTPTTNRTWTEHDVDVTGPDEIELKINARAEGFHTRPTTYYLTRQEAADLATSLSFAVQDSDPDAGYGDDEAEKEYRDTEARAINGAAR